MFQMNRYLVIGRIRKLRNIDRGGDQIGRNHFLVDHDDGDSERFVEVSVIEPPTDHRTHQQFVTLDPPPLPWWKKPML